MPQPQSQPSRPAAWLSRALVFVLLVTLFGADLPSQPNAKIGHYLVGNAGDLSALGCTAALRTLVASRVQGSVAYSLTNAQLTANDDLRYLVLIALSALYRQAERIHDVSTSIETNVPETSTRVLVLYRVSNGFARPFGSGQSPDRPGLGSRFDVQVRQPVEPAGQVPVPLAEQLHARRHEHRPDDRRV